MDTLDQRVLKPEDADFDLNCRVAIEQSDENVFAHMLTAKRLELHPGDIVQILGEPMKAEQGKSIIFRRRAAVKRAGIFKRFWMRFIAVFQITGLYEVSFSPRSKL